MDIWEWLGIQPTTDIARIKSAYARQAKLYHPEEHPEEFKALQNSYKMAIWMAKNQRAASYETPADISEKGPEKELSEDISKGESKGELSEDISKEDMGEEAQKVISSFSAEHSFDFSGVDSYGYRERFFCQFLLIGENPYLRNNLDAWDYFLDRKEFEELFADTDFRIKFVHTMCSLSGWRRKTVLYFERYLTKFHTQENKPVDGKWETELAGFRIRKLPYPRLPAFCTDRFLEKEGAAFHKWLRSQISRAQGREISLDIKSDLIQYMKLYLSYEESKSRMDFMERLHREWVKGRNVLNGIALVVCFFVVWMLVHPAGQQKENENRLSYLMELYDLEADTCSDEEKEELLWDYDCYWKYAEEAMDEVVERYENW